MVKLFNIARMTTLTTGTGTVTLGSAASGYIDFTTAGVANGDVVTYVLEEGGNREIGRGTYSSSGTTLSRDQVLKSTNGGSKISLSGAALVFLTAAAEDIANINEFNTFTVNQEIESTASGASIAPTLYLKRRSAGAGGNELGQAAFTGRDSNSNETIYASLNAFIVDPTDGSEDGGVRVRTVVAGTFAARFDFGAGFYPTSLADQGAGTVNAAAYYLNNNRMSDWTMVAKTSDTSRSSTAATSADPALQFAMAASTRYAIRIKALYTTADTPDFKFGLAGPASPALVQGHYLLGLQATAVAGTSFASYPANVAAATTPHAQGTITLELIVQNGANSGTFSFDWAQNTSNASATIVKAGSYLEYRVI